MKKAAKTTLISTVLTTLLLVLTLAAPAAGAEMLTLQEAVETALRENPLLRAYTWRLRGGEEELKIAKGHLYPRITVEETVQNTDNPPYSFMAKLNQERFGLEDFQIDTLNDPDPTTDFRTTLGFAMPLYSPRIYSGIELAGRELKAKRAEFARKKEEIVLEVVRTYLSVQTAHGYVEASAKGLEDAREHLRLAELRYENGMGLYSDLLRAKVAVKEAEAMVVKAESNLATAKRALGLLLGRDAEIEVTDGRPLPPLGELDTYLEAAAGRQDLRALKLRHENSLEAVAMEKASRLPEIGMGGSYQLNDHDTPFGSEGRSYQVMVFVRLNLFDAATSHRIRKAGAAAREVGEYYDGLMNEIRFRVHEAYGKVLEKSKSLELSRAALKEAEEARRLVEVRYENSLARMVDLLDTQAVLDRTRTKVLEAEKDYLLSVAELYFQSGTLMKSLEQAAGIQLINRGGD